MPQAQFGRQMHTRVPPRVQQIMAKKLERSVPGYMKQYVAPYMQQNVVHPDLMPGATSGPTPELAAVHPVLHPPTGQSWRQTHFQPTNSPTTPQPAQPAPPGQANQATTPDNPYNFITEPMPQPRQALRLPGASSLAIRAAYVVGGLLVLFIIFSVVKNVISGPSSFQAFLPVAQDQQEINHLLANATRQQNQNLSTSTQNFIATAQLSIPSNQSDLLQYLAKNNYKIKPKNLNLKLNASLDSQLMTATANTTYESTFVATMSNQLNGYTSDLNQAFNQTKGKNGHALLSSYYAQAKLLLTQLGQPSQ